MECVGSCHLLCWNLISVLVCTALSASWLAFNAGGLPVDAQHSEHACWASIIATAGSLKCAGEGSPCMVEGRGILIKGGGIHASSCNSLAQEMAKRNAQPLPSTPPPANADVLTLNAACPTNQVRLRCVSSWLWNLMHRAPPAGGPCERQAATAVHVANT